MQTDTNGGMWKLWRYAPATVLVAAALLLLATTVVAIQTDRGYEEQRQEQLTVQARIVGSAVTAALVFDDAKAVQEYLNALAANPEIRVAAVYDEAGARVAAYSRAEGEEAPLQRPPAGTGQGRNGALATVPVVHDGTTYGTVFLRTDPEPVERRVARYAGVTGLAVMTVFIFGALALAQTALTRANRELEARATALAKANTELQAEMTERERAEEALRQAQKMETIGQLTGGVAHDFNNLLAIIVGNIERLQRWIDEHGQPAAIKRAADNAMIGAQRAAALTRSLLAFSRRQPLDPKPVDINKLVSGMSDLLRRTLGEQIVIETVVAGGLWRTLADPNQLENALLNLAVNARDAMPEGGKLTLETANAYLDDRYADGHEEVTPGQYVMISVTDTGTGMSAETIERVFEPFFTTKITGHGTGLGLSQVYGFVKQSGGHVKVYSEPGEGTTVKIYLPRLAGEVAEAASDEGVDAVGPSRGESVLVVEDDDGVREHSVDTLRELGYRVLAAADARAALRLLAREPDVSLLFTDVGLPGGMNGRQLADEACRRLPHLKVLFTTGYARNAIVHEGRLDPGVHLVTKPFTRVEVAAAIRRLLDAEARVPTVLLVEDELLIRMNTAETLEEMGLRVLQADSAAAARQQCAVHGHELDAAIVDLGLPDGSGTDLVALLRARRAGLPVVLATGHPAPVGPPEVGGDPPVQYLPKPYEATRLRNALAAAGLRLVAKDEAGSSGPA